MSNKTKQRKKRLRRQRNAEKRQELFRDQTPRSREGGIFFGKARSGDAAEVRIDFRGGLQVPFDQETDITEDVKERAERLLTFAQEGDA